VKRACILSAVVLWLACASNVFGASPKVSVTYIFGSGPIDEGGSSTTSVKVDFLQEAKTTYRQVLNGIIKGDTSGLTWPVPPTVSFGSAVDLTSGIYTFDASGTFFYMHPGDAIRFVEGTARYRKKIDDKWDTVNFSSELTHLLVNNVLPGIELTSPGAVDENELFALHVAATDPGVPVHNFTYAWDLDNDHLFDDATGANVQHSFSQFGVYEVGVRVDDGEGGASEGKVKLTVLEPAPQPPDPGQVPEPASVVIWGVGGLCAAAAAWRRRKGKQQPRWSEETRNAIYAVVHARPE